MNYKLALLISGKVDYGPERNSNILTALVQKEERQRALNLAEVAAHPDALEQREFLMDECTDWQFVRGRIRAHIDLPGSTRDHVSLDQLEEALDDMIKAAGCRQPEAMDFFLRHNVVGLKPTNKTFETYLGLARDPLWAVECLLRDESRHLFLGMQAWRHCEHVMSNQDERATYPNKSLKEAIKHLDVAAKAGILIASYALDEIYSTPRSGSHQSEEKAIAILEEANDITPKVAETLTRLLQHYAKKGSPRFNAIYAMNTISIMLELEADNNGDDNPVFEPLRQLILLGGLIEVAPPEQYIVVLGGMKKWRKENKKHQHDFFADGYSHAMYTVCKHARQLMMDAKHAEDEGNTETSRALYNKAWDFIEVLTDPGEHPYPMAYFLRARFHEFGYGGQPINLQSAKLYYTHAAGTPKLPQTPQYITMRFITDEEKVEASPEGLLSTRATSKLQVERVNSKIAAQKKKTATQKKQKS